MVQEHLLHVHKNKQYVVHCKCKSYMLTGISLSFWVLVANKLYLWFLSPRGRTTNNNSHKTRKTNTVNQTIFHFLITMIAKLERTLSNNKQVPNTEPPQTMGGALNNNNNNNNNRLSRDISIRHWGIKGTLLVPKFGFKDIWVSHDQ